MPTSNLEKYLSQQKQLSGETLFFDADALMSAHGDDRRTVVIDVATESAESPGFNVENPIIEQAPMMNEQWHSATSLSVLNEQICNCMKCDLGATRTKFVFGVGNPQADIVVIGEAPGADEDAQGEPFVGRAGQLLTKILEAIQLQRDDVFICNILKCRPPGNRVPLASEVDSCEPYLYKQLELLQPKFILALGLTAVNTLLKSKFRMADVRGKFFNYQDVRMMTTYHPAALLRNPEWKKAAWEDVKQLKAAYDAFRANGSLPAFDPQP